MALVQDRYCSPEDVKGCLLSCLHSVSSGPQPGGARHSPLWLQNSCSIPDLTSHWSQERSLLAASSPSHYTSKMSPHILMPLFRLGVNPWISCWGPWGEIPTCLKGIGIYLWSPGEGGQSSPSHGTENRKVTPQEQNPGPFLSLETDPGQRKQWLFPTGCFQMFCDEHMRKEKYIKIILRKDKKETWGRRMKSFLASWEEIADLSHALKKYGNSCKSSGVN